MSMHAEKLELIQWLVALKDVSVLEKIKWLKEQNKEAADWWDELSNAEKASIEQGLKDVEEGKTTPHEEVKKNYGKWL